MKYNKYKIVQKFRTKTVKTVKKGSEDMETKLKRMTIVVTPDIEERMDRIKKEFYYNRSRSDMVRELIAAGLRALEEKEEAKEYERVS